MLSPVCRYDQAATRFKPPPALGIVTARLSAQSPNDAWQAATKVSCSRYRIPAAVIRSMSTCCQTTFRQIAWMDVNSTFVNRAGELVEQRLGVFQVSSVEAFSEPTVAFGQH